MFDIKEYEAAAMLELADDEREMLAIEANAINDSFIVLDKIQTDGVRPLVSVLDAHNVLREDISEKLITRDDLMANAPERYNGYFQVPGTLE